jgi:DHA1 family bicyclomycin/chloramphenicol resistance-like MFS transporter
MRRMSHGALIAFLSIAFVWMIWSLAFGSPPLTVFLAFFIPCNFFFGWIGANFNAISMEPLARVAGTGSAVVGFLQTAGGGLIGAWIGQSFDGTPIPIAIGYFTVAILGLILVLIAEGGRLFRVGSGS